MSLVGIALLPHACLTVFCFFSPPTFFVFLFFFIISPVKYSQPHCILVSYLYIRLPPPSFVSFCALNTLVHILPCRIVLLLLVINHRCCSHGQCFICTWNGEPNSGTMTTRDVTENNWNCALLQFFLLNSPHDAGRPLFLFQLPPHSFSK